VVRARKETTEDDNSPDDTLPRDGTIAGGANTNSGINSTMFAPSSPAWQSTIIESCRKAAIAPADVEAVECYASGKGIKDCVEVTATVIALRNGRFSGTQGAEEMLTLGASKTNGGNAVECSGLVGLAKLMHSIEWGIIPGNQHVRQLNPYLDVADTELLINDEVMHFSSRVVFAGVSAFGMGGTNVHLTMYGSIDEEKRPAPEPTPEDCKPCLAYWPAGGGDVGSGARPRSGYYVIGTFNNWTADDQMKVEDNGVFSYVIALGENRWESFQISLDGDSEKLLHPPLYQAPKGTKVVGPDESPDAAELVWLIDGRSEMVSQAMLSDATSEALATADDALVEWGGEDKGAMGDQYKITLHVAGKWRTVSWSKLTPEQVGTKKEPIAGTYYVAGDFSGWELTEMTQVGPGQFSLQVALIFSSNDFVIVRNADWHQTLYPASPTQGSESDILGPEDRYADLAWNISGKVDEKVTIELQRSGTSIKVSWKRP
jgi:hypothetical protein